MRIGILSDTHNRPDGIDKACAIFTEAHVEVVLHCGDWTTPESVQYTAAQLDRLGLPLIGVLGNNDKDTAGLMQAAGQYANIELTSGVREVQFDDKSAVIYHGHHAPTLRQVLAADYDLVLLGHSHKPRYDRHDHKVVINPGSTAFAIPRSREWRGSVVIYDTGRHEAEFVYFTS
jgi:hypothetical protein